jgi:outer membrane lipoprotein-sorting protein
MKIDAHLTVRRRLRRISPVLIAAFLCALLAPLALYAQTVDEVIAKNIQAHGGLEKLKTVQTIRATGKFSQGSFSAGFMQENKRPGKVREEALIQGLAQIQAYDGKTGWQVSPFGGRKDAELLSQDDLKSLMIDADIDGPLVDYKEKGHKAELVGHDSVEGTDCYKVKLTLKNGDVRYYFLDTDSFLEIKMENQSNIRGAVQFTENYYGDYEQVNGLYFPFAFEGGEKGNPVRTRYTVQKIEVNVALADSLFSMPVSKSEAKPNATQPQGKQ